MLHSTFYILHSRRAQAALATVLTIGGIIVIIGVALAFFASSFVNSAYGFQLSQRAETAAMGGVYDALIQLSRNKDFSSSGYSVTAGADTATVTVTNPSGLNPVTIVSTATVSFRQRTITVTATRDTTTGEITTISWTRT